MVSFCIYLGLLIAQMLFSAWIAISFDSMLSDPLSALFTYTAIALAFAGTTLILSLLVLVLYLMGFGYLYGGRNEFDSAHRSRTSLAMYLIIGAIITTVVGGFITFGLEISMFSLFGPIDTNVLYTIVGVNAVTGTISAAFVALALALPIYGLTEKRYEPYIYLAAALGTATPGIVSAVTFLQLPRFIDMLTGSGSLSGLGWSAGLPTLVGGALGLFTFVLFILLYRNVSVLIKTGQLKPTPPQPPPMMWMPVQVVPVVPVYPVYQPPMPPQPGAPPPAPPRAPPQSPPQ